MSALSHSGRCWLGVWVAGALVAFTGCQTVHEVTVDAINNPQKAGGASYRLEVNDPGGGVDKELQAQVVAHVRAALEARGLYEAPANTRPDMIVEAEYGLGPGQVKIVYRPQVIDAVGGMIGPSSSAAKPILVFEKYLALTARAAAEEETPPARGAPPNRGEELWSVRVSVEDPKKDLAAYLPVLAHVTIDYIGANSGAEKRFKVNAADVTLGRRVTASSPP